MIFNTSIKTYLRLDDMMMSTVLPATTAGYHAKDHWLVWTIPNYNMTPEIEAWLANQPASASAKIRFIGLYNGMVEDAVGGTHTAIGVSLSSASNEMLYKLYRSKKPMSLIHAYTTEDLKPTKHPLLFTDCRRPDFLYYKLIPKPIDSLITPRNDVVDPVLVEKFKDSLKGHDFWYSYSDSSSVYRAGEARTKRLIDAGVEMGLTKEQADKLYKEVYTELSKP